MKVKVTKNENDFPVWLVEREDGNSFTIEKTENGFSIFQCYSSGEELNYYLTYREALTYCKQVEV